MNARPTLRERMEEKVAECFSSLLVQDITAFVKMFSMILIVVEKTMNVVAKCRHYSTVLKPEDYMLRKLG